MPLEPVGSVEFLVPAIADSIELSLRGQEEPRVQLFRYLGEKQLLMVLDNFEHLVTASALLSDMLSATRNLKLIVTTREALKLSEEWVFPVPGMRFPEANAVAGPENYDAVRLFVERAQRVKRGYSPEADWGSHCPSLPALPGDAIGRRAGSLVGQRSLLQRDRCRDRAQPGFPREQPAQRTRAAPQRARCLRAVVEPPWPARARRIRSAISVPRRVRARGRRSNRRRIAAAAVYPGGQVPAQAPA